MNFASIIRRTTCKKLSVARAIQEALHFTSLISLALSSNDLLHINFNEKDFTFQRSEEKIWNISRECASWNDECAGVLMAHLECWRNCEFLIWQLNILHFTTDRKFNAVAGSVNLNQEGETKLPSCYHRFFWIALWKQSPYSWWMLRRRWKTLFYCQSPINFTIR